MRLGDLLRDESLRLELLTDAAGCERPVEGAHAIELVDAGRYLERDWVVLTTGLSIARSAPRQQAFVRSLATAGASAVGFGVDVNVATVPPALLRTADEHDLPVFSVPAPTTFSVIVRRVMTEVLHEAGPRVSRLLTMQERLVATLDEPEPEDAVLKMLGSMLGAAGGIVLAGTVVAEVGAPRWSALLEQIEAEHGYRAAEDHVTVCVPIGGDAADVGFLAMSVPRGPTEQYARPLVRFAAVVLQLAATGRRVALEQQRAVRSGVLSDLLATARLSGELIERVKGFGFDPAQPVRCAVFLSPPDETLQRQLVAALDRFFADRRIARLTRIHGRDIIVAWQGSYTGGGLLDAVSHLPSGDGIVGGVGPVTCLREGEVFASAVAGARAAALQASDAAGGTRLTSYEDLDYCDLVLAFVPPDQHRAAPSPLEVLRQEKTDLISTLCAYFDHDLDVVSCAKSLNLHPNSLRYRLSRLEHRLGRSLRSPGTIADLYLALRAERMHGEPPERAVTVAARHAARSRAPLA